MNLDPEHTSCCLCGSDSSRQIGQGKDYDCKTCDNWWTCVLCDQCGHEYLNPRPRIADASSIYPSNYFGATLVHSDPEQAGFIQKTRRVLERSRYKRILKRLPSRPSILDVGFGDGRVLILLRTLLGKEATLTGLDLNATQIVKNLLGRYDIQYLNGLFETSDLPASQYDMVVMNQVIEHFWNPREMVQKIRKILKPNGYVFIETPNPDCLCRRFQGNQFWGGFHFPRHLNWFNRGGLHRLLTQNAFSVIDYQEFVSPVFWIAGYHNLLKNREGFLSKKIADWITLERVAPLAFFTIVELITIKARLHASNHRIVAQMEK